jgi:glycosyltransferase involved in cell wall biosynthesis
VNLLHRGGVNFPVQRCQGEFMEHPLVQMCTLDVTLFVPCYNEEQNIVPTFESIVEACRQVELSYEIIVIDDASSDRSVEVIRAFQDTHPEIPIRLICNPVNMGVAHNFTEAAFWGQGRHYRIVCGDNVESVETQVAILSKLGQADLVVPYPVAVVNKSWSRHMLSRTYTRLVNLVSGHRLRYWNGCALMGRYDVMRWHPRTSGFGFQAQILNRLLSVGRSFVEVGCSYNERPTGRSKALTWKNFESVAAVLTSILLFRCRGAASRLHAHPAKRLGLPLPPERAMARWSNKQECRAAG